jgi:PAS domain S-box-containing protein
MMPENSEEQQSAEAEVEGFRANLGPFVVAAETTRMAMLFTDARLPGNPIIFANNSFLALTGYSREEVMGQDFKVLMMRGTDPEQLSLIEAAFEGSNDGLKIHYRRKDGTEFWANFFISPVKDVDGNVVQYFSSFADFTHEHKQQIRSDVLIAELNHRVKNTLSTVMSITTQAFRNSTNPEVIKKSIESRLFALSRSHEILTHEKWESAKLSDVIKAATEAFRITGNKTERFTVTGPRVRVRPNAALILGVAMHELATNAVKYGALSNEVGSVSISWVIEPTLEGDRLSLRWQEKGGPLVTPPSRKGFGSRVIERGLAHELSGTVHLDYQAGGVVCTINIPARRLKLQAE